MPALSNIRHKFSVFGFCEEFFFKEKRAESSLWGYNKPVKREYKYQYIS